MNRMPQAALLRVEGVVQGVGFRPFVFHLAQLHRIAGWVRNGSGGVEIHAEGEPEALDAFKRELRARAPSAAGITEVVSVVTGLHGFEGFEILESEARGKRKTRISPDLPTCQECLAELADGANRRYGHPYISCAHCGPRYSIITGVPYDRAATTMAAWPMCAECAREYNDPSNRRFHAQPIACHGCGPRYTLIRDATVATRDLDAIREAAASIREGGIIAIKGIGGYHLACDAYNDGAVAALRARKYRKEKPFGLMAKDLAVARELVELSREREDLLVSNARPIVLAPARTAMPLVAPASSNLGVMLPYTPVHHLLFACGAPPVLVMTSANRSDDPIAYEDDDALARLSGIADAFLVGERAIARRVDDSVARIGALGPQLVRRSRGFPLAVGVRIPLSRPVLALGGDLKNTVTLVVGGDAMVSQHIGDLGDAAVASAFKKTVADLLAMYDVDVESLVVAHDRHPEYASTAYAQGLPAHAWQPVQHHHAHVASVLAEREDFETRVLGIAFDGTGYGDDDTIWGGEFFVGSVRAGFRRVAHLRPALLPGGDAAARSPVQAAAGFLAAVPALPDMLSPPFEFPRRFLYAQRVLDAGTRTFTTTSVGRLFDAVAALLGFTREVSFEGQAAMWLEYIAGKQNSTASAPVVFRDGQLDFRATLQAVIEDRIAGRPTAEIARQFHLNLASGVAAAAQALCEQHEVNVVVLSGGVFQNDLLMHDVVNALGSSKLELWTNRLVPPNDGGISLGQAALLLQY